MAEPQAGFGFRFVAPLALGSALNAVNSSLIATAMVPIALDLGVAAADTAWLITSLYLASAVAQPAMGKLADLFGPRRVLVASLLVVAASGVLGFVAASLGMLIVARVLVGIGTSGPYPAAMRMFRDRSDALGLPPPRQAIAMLTFCALGVTAVGPLLGGVLTARFGWHAIFAVNLPQALGALVPVLLWLPPDKARTAPGGSWGELDGIGLLLFTGSLIAAMLVLMGLPRPDWRAAATALVLGAALGAWSWRRTAPFLDLRMLARNRPLTLSYLRFGAVMMICYCMFFGFAQWLQGAGGYTPQTAGLMTLPMPLLAAFGSLATARAGSARQAFAIACGAALIGSIALSLLDQDAAPWLLAAAAAPFGLAMGMVPTATQIILYEQAPADQIGTAAGLQRTFGYLGSITASGLLALSFGARPSDAGFHTLMAVLGVTSLVVLVAVLLDRTLPEAAEQMGQG